MIKNFIGFHGGEIVRFGRDSSLFLIIGLDLRDFVSQSKTRAGRFQSATKETGLGLLPVSLEWMW